MMRTWRLVLLLLTSGATAEAQESRREEGGPPAILEQYVGAYNSGDSTRMIEWFERHLDPAELRRTPIPERIARYRHMRDELGDISVQDVRLLSGRAELEAAASKMEGRLTLTFFFDDAPPYRLRSMEVRVESGEPEPPLTEGPPVVAPVANPPGRVVGEQGAAIDSLLSHLELRGLAGAVLVVQRGRTVLHAAYGMANRDRGIPYDTATVVQIGSNTKDFTFTAVLQLVERGRLGLDEPIGGYLDGVPADKAGITIRQLLSHRSGLPAGTGGDFEPVSRDEMIRRIFASELVARPGEQFHYSNAGYSLLAALIEMRSGLGYERFLQSNIFDPVGMRNTGGVIHAWDRNHLAHSYTATGVDRRTMLDRGMAPDGAYWNLRGNGGLLSTVGDMRRFYDALAAGSLIRPEHRDLLYRPGAGFMLAGSDGTSFFAYAHEPDVGAEVLIGTSDARVPGTGVAQAILELLKH